MFLLLYASVFISERIKGKKRKEGPKLFCNHELTHHVFLLPALLLAIPALSQLLSMFLSQATH